MNAASRRYGLGFLVTAIVWGVSTQTAAQQSDYPSRPVTLVMPFAAGSATDGAVRLVAKGLQERFNVPVIVVNRPGGNHMVAISALRAAPSDGYTLLIGTGSSLWQNVAFLKDLPYEPMKEFSFVGTIGVHPGILVARPSLPVDNTRDLVTYARKNPNKLNYSSGGIGTSNHLFMEIFQAKTGTVMTHIPMKSDPQVGMELMAERVDVSFMTGTTSFPLIEGGKLKVLATSTPQRLSFLPNVPTMTEAGLPELEGLHPFTIAAVVGRADLDPVIIKRLNDALREVVGSAEVSRTLNDNMRMVPLIMTPDEFRTLVQTEIGKWKQNVAQMSSPSR